MELPRKAAQCICKDDGRQTAEREAIDLPGAVGVVSGVGGLLAGSGIVVVVSLEARGPAHNRALRPGLGLVAEIRGHGMSYNKQRLDRLRLSVSPGATP